MRLFKKSKNDFTMIQGCFLTVSFPLNETLLYKHEYGFIAFLLT